MNKQQQIALDLTHRKMTELQKVIEAGNKMLRFISRHKKEILTKGEVRVSIDANQLTNDWRNHHFWADLPTDVVLKELVPIIKKMIEKAKKDLDELEIK